MQIFGKNVEFSSDQICEMTGYHPKWHFSIHLCIFSLKVALLSTKIKFHQQHIKQTSASEKKTSHNDIGFPTINVNRIYLLQILVVIQSRHYVPQTKVVYCFRCGSRRRCFRHPCSFLSALYLLNQWVDFDQTCTDTLLGRGKEVVGFWWPWPHFQGHTSTLNYQILTKKSLSAPISWTKWRILAKLHVL